MGFSIYYRSTRPVSPEEEVAIRRTAHQASVGRTWLSCEPVHFFNGEPDDDGRLFGGSKPNFLPHPDDAASAASAGLPDGDVRDLFDVLCHLSRDHGVDWEISHEHAPEPAGYIRDGVCDPGLNGLPESLADMTRLIAEFENGGPPDDDDGEGPALLQFWGDT